jgi:hypothetical protein
MSEMKSWELVGKSGFGSLPIKRPDETRNFFIAPAMLTRRMSKLASNREFMDVVVEWQTSDERFSVGVEGDMEFQSGDKLNVLLSTVTSVAMGCVNGYAAVEALERAPGDWSPNTKI